MAYNYRKAAPKAPARSAHRGRNIATGALIVGALIFGAVYLAGGSSQGFSGFGRFGAIRGIPKGG